MFASSLSVLRRSPVFQGRLGIRLGAIPADARVLLDAVDPGSELIHHVSLIHRQVPRHRDDRDSQLVAAIGPREVNPSVLRCAGVASDGNPSLLREERLNVGPALRSDVRIELVDHVYHPAFLKAFRARALANLPADRCRAVSCAALPPNMMEAPAVSTPLFTSPTRR